MRKLSFKYFINWFPALLTLTVIIFVFLLTSNQILVIYMGELDFSNAIGVCILIIYIHVNLLLIASFFSLSILDPGSLESLQCQLEAPDDLKSTKRYCNKCTIRKWKPPRAHHCSVCNKCIFKMDHHCFLINNCIGYSNQKNYILFLFYLICSTLITVLSVFFIIIKCLFSTTRKVTGINFKFIYINLIANIVILLCSSSFFIDQIDSILTNSSLVELIANKKGREMRLINKFYSVFGQNIYLWFIPLSNNNKPEFVEELYEIINYPNSLSSEIIEPNISGLNDYISCLPNINAVLIKGKNQ